MRKFIKKLLGGIAAALVSSASMLSQTPDYTLTPNIGLQIPPYNSPAWQIPFDYNFYQLDLFLSGKLALPSFGVTGQAQLPQLTTWLTGSTYTAGQLVFYLGSPFTSTQNSNQGNLPTNASFWTPGVVTVGITPGSTLIFSPVQLNTGQIILLNKLLVLD